MGTANFIKDKIKVEYTTKLSFKEDAKALKQYQADADKLIKQIEKPDEWGFEFAIDSKKKKVDRIKSITYPQIRNGHQGESGHDWQWQLDTESAGKGSKVRLYLDDAKAAVKNTDNSKTVKVGKEEFTVVECEVTVTGKFTADQKH